jgi:hypothetical protein
MLTFLSVRFGDCQIVLSVFMWPFNVKDVTVVYHLLHNQRLGLFAFEGSSEDHTTLNAILIY